jgi:MOSC domain-containing protein YiiM
MKLLSVNCGLPRQIAWRGRDVVTSIFKEPVAGRVALRTLNLDGDRQSDLTVHGGKDKAAYCYSIEHYEYWKAELQESPLAMGAFGENFTVEALREDSVCIGDRFAIGTAEIIVTQPRMPCFKLGIRFESDEIVGQFLASGRTGFYVAVTREGEVGAADEIVPLGGDPGSISVAETFRLYLANEYDSDDISQVRRVLAQRALSASWKEVFQEKLQRQGL